MRPGKCVRGMGGNRGGQKSCCVGKGGKHCIFSGEVIMESVGSPEE